MSTLEFQKQQLQYRINEIEDEKLLQKILDMVNEEQPSYELTEEQKLRLLKGKQEIEEGKSKSDEQLNKEVSEWLRKK